MREINTDGVTYLEMVPGAEGEWYYAIDYEQGDLYEAEDLFKEGYPVKGRKLFLIHYPDGEVYVPVSKQADCYSETPLFYKNSIYMLNVMFAKGVIQIVRFDCASHETQVYAEVPLSSVKDCYNLSLSVEPLCLTRERENEFELVWPEKVTFSIEDPDSFYLRDGDTLYFSRWYEEGEGVDYKYWEQTIVRDLNGTVLDTLSGYVRRMPNGELWFIK